MNTRRVVTEKHFWLNPTSTIPSLPYPGECNVTLSARDLHDGDVIVDGVVDKNARTDPDAPSARIWQCPVCGGEVVELDEDLTCLNPKHGENCND